MGERERLPGACDADVGEPPFLFEVVFVERTGVWESPLLHPDDVDVPELEPFALWSVINVTRPPSEVRES